MKTISSAIIALLFFSFCHIPEEKVGPVVLVGGGKIPPKAVEWVKNRSAFDHF